MRFINPLVFLLILYWFCFSVFILQQLFNIKKNDIRNSTIKCYELFCAKKDKYKKLKSDLLRFELKNLNSNLAC